MADLYIIFHLNLSFSSIEQYKRKEVVESCYWPLLELAESSNIPIGIELTGWTLNEILNIDTSWVLKFKQLLQLNKCELIGSGWSQIIGPLVPHEVNIWNQKLGLNFYQKTLGVIPKIALVNEMAYSSSLVDVYKDVGYEGIIIDRDNVLESLSKNTDGYPNKIPTHAKGLNKNSILPILWSDTVLFQKFQRVVHNDISIEEYIDFLSKIILNNEHDLIPIYTNDAEVFDFRPGRFQTEKLLKTKNEWKRINNILHSLSDLNKVRWVSPSKALNRVLKKENNVQKLTSIGCPVIVKKQKKYNINRWAISGRDDLLLNTFCHSKFKRLLDEKVKGFIEWQNLCELWSSDLRTHITEARWREIQPILFDFKKSLLERSVAERSIKSLKSKTDGSFKIERNNNYLLVRSKGVQVRLNLSKGLAIDSLAFSSNGFTPVIGKIDQGQFDLIEYKVDFFSGTLICELREELRKITDLTIVEPKINYEDRHLVISANFNLGNFCFEKFIRISEKDDSIEIDFDFKSLHRPICSLRVANLTFLNNFTKSDVLVACFDRGLRMEEFLLGPDFDHGKDVSFIVSSNSSFGSSLNRLLIESNDLLLNLEWNPHECAALPMASFKNINDNHFFRVMFSLTETDDTIKTGGSILPFRLRISAEPNLNRTSANSTSD